MKIKIIIKYIKGNEYNKKIVTIYQEANFFCAYNH